MAIALVGPASAGAAPKLVTVVVGGAARHAAALRSARRGAVIARAEKQLGAARSDYAGSRFARCARRLERAEREVRRLISSATLAVDLGLLKRINLWLGLCRVVSGSSAAGPAFMRASTLPGPPPDPTLLPPAAMSAYGRGAAAAAKRATCRVKIDPGVEVWLDGRRVAAGQTISMGERYLLRRDRGVERSDRASIAPSCRPALPAEYGPAALTAAEAKDPTFLATFGRAAGATKLLLVYDRSDAIALSVFNVSERRFVERRESAIGRDRPLLSTVPSSLPRRRGDRERRRWYQRWWVWTLVGIGVATAVAVPIVITSSSKRYDLTF